MLRHQHKTDDVKVPRHIITLLAPSLWKRRARSSSPASPFSSPSLIWLVSFLRPFSYPLTSP